MKYEKMMNNISPIDGRYKDKLKYVNQYFSEFGIIKAKIFIEVNYLKFISTEFSKDCDIDKIIKYIDDLEDTILYDKIKIIESVIPGVTFETIDVDKGDPRVMEYGVRSIPTTIILNMGEVMDRETGVVSEQRLKQMIK
jgi:hypothetical protein